MCEPTPFIHQSKFRLVADGETVSQFQKRRKELQEAFAQEYTFLVAEGRPLPKLKVAKHNTMIAKVECNVTNKAVDEVSKLVTNLIDDLACVMNAALQSVDEARRVQAAVVPQETLDPPEISTPEVSTEEVVEEATDEGGEVFSVDYREDEDESARYPFSDPDDAE